MASNVSGGSDGPESGDRTSLGSRSARSEGRVTSATIASYWESPRVRLYVGTRCLSADTFLQLISSRCICPDGRRVRGELTDRSSLSQLSLRAPRARHACSRSFRSRTFNATFRKKKRQSNVSFGEESKEKKPVKMIGNQLIVTIITISKISVANVGSFSENIRHDFRHVSRATSFIFSFYDPPIRFPLPSSLTRDARSFMVARQDTAAILYVRQGRAPARRSGCATPRRTVST